jgi:hypothetical protein
MKAGRMKQVARTGTVPADKGFIDTIRQALLQERQGITVITPV